MKLLNNRNVHFDKSTKQLLKLLEYNPDFEEGIWIARANLGIKPSNLLCPQELPNNITVAFEKAWQKREPTPTIDEIRNITKILDNLPEVEFKKATESDEGNELIIKAGLEEQKLHERVLVFSAILLDGFVLPINWIYPIAHLIRYGIFTTYGSTEPLSIHVDTKWLRKKGISQSNFTNLIPYIDKSPQGVQFVISAKIKHKNELTEWLDKHWHELQKVMELTELPDYWQANLRNLDQTIGIIELQQQHPELSLSKIIELYEENLPDTIDTTNESVKQAIKQFKVYVHSLTKKARKNS